MQVALGPGPTAYLHVDSPVERYDLTEDAIHFAHDYAIGQRPVIWLAREVNEDLRSAY
jgi:hypothetical protein